MDYNIIKSKFLITILSSSNSDLLKLSYNTIIEQLNNPFNYDIILIINSIDSNYYNDVKKKFENIDIEIIQTKSNGKPGMGHNSCINIFKNRKQYDYLIHIDGDDFLYPYAFHQLYKAIIETKKNNIYIDILVLQGNDLISWYNQSNNTSDIYLNNSIYLIKQDEYPHNKWNFNKNIVNINPFISKTFITPIRPILYSRNIFKLDIKEFFCNDCYILDDYLFYLHFINIFINNKLNISIINSSHIYLYNDCNIQSVQKTYNIDSDYLKIKSYKSLFQDIINYFKNDWNMLNLPFTYITPPFSDIFDNYNISNNYIQIINYNDYLDNINTKYCIDFSKIISVKLFTIFKFNMDYWLNQKAYDKAYNLSNTLIINNIDNPEIYNYLCVSAYFLKKYNIINQYINKSIPYCNSYSYLQKFL